MTALLASSSWKQHNPAAMTSTETAAAHDVLADAQQMQEARVWTSKLRDGDQHGASPTPTGAAHSPPQSPPATKARVVETSSKKHRFSLRRLFKHEHHDKKGSFVPPVPIPTDFLTREKHGGVTVSGRRVPFTRDAYRRRKKVVKPMPRINEDHALVPVSSSLEAYRRRAYYPAKKHSKTKK
jgi:hypothetical protein